MNDTERVRVVAVDDEAVTLAIITHALANHPRIELVGTGVNGRDALQLANRLHPDVMVLDVGMPVLNGVEAAARIRATFPSIGVLMLTAETDPEIAKAALRAGALDYLSKSTEVMRIGDAILDANRRRKSGAPERGPASIWTFYGPKGCSGTSTLAVNAALHLVRLSYRVLLVDLDMMQGDCGFILGLKPRQATEHLLAQVQEAGGIDEAMVAHAVRTINLPGHDGPALHVLESPTTFFPLEGATEESLNILMEFVGSQYDYLVVDLPPGRLFDRAIAPLLDSSERFFVTSNSDLLSLKCLVSLSRVLAEASFNMEKLGVIFAGMISHPDFDHKEFILAQKLGIRSLQDMPLDRGAAADALALGMPSILGSPGSPLAAFSRLLVEQALNLPPSPGEKRSIWRSFVTRVGTFLGSVHEPLVTPDLSMNRS